ncbi:hypothetical protein U1Q18_043030 [Sarracenia purpurea var. burkii]
MNRRGRRFGDKDSAAGCNFGPRPWAVLALFEAATVQAWPRLDPSSPEPVYVMVGAGSARPEFESEIRVEARFPAR